MAKNAAANSGKSLVIVESPAKARTISKYLGPGFRVEASIGHIRDLPEGAKQMPKKFKDEEWAYLGVNVNDDFTPIYIVPADKKPQVKKLKEALDTATELFLATDEDREGEAISWHLAEILKPKVPVRRLVFHEITEEAIQDSLKSPRQIDDKLVRAQETRRILDRLYGYEVSPLLWRKVGPRLSAGRVQSVAIRLIVEREQERREFVSSEYWDLLGMFVGGQSAVGENEPKPFEAKLISCDDRRLPSGKDFDSSTGKIKKPDLLLLNEQQARELAERLSGAEFRISKLEEKPYKTKPPNPFITSSLQQEANRKLGFTAKRTMTVAQSLYENGYITYMRTDSTSLAKVAVEAARDLVTSEYGPEYLPSTPRQYDSKVKNAQEAHEAIRPAGHPFKMPESLRSQLNSDQFKLFDLIWKRTIASQMNDAEGRRISIRIEGGGAVFQVSGKTIDFPGFLRAYVEGADDPTAELADKETLLPAVKVDEVVQCRRIDPKGHVTQPPARYSEASLTGKLEEMGIGRPSTYASIIETIQRKYVFKKGSALAPTWTAFSVVRLLKEHLAWLVDYDFTAEMENLLDEISRGEKEYLEYLQGFYFGNGRPGLKKQLAEKIKEVDARAISRFLLGKPSDKGIETSGGVDKDETIYVRVGKYGPFLEQGELKASLPDQMPPDEVTLEKAVELLQREQKGEEPLGVDPETEKPVYLKQGRFGPYVQLGEPDDKDKKNASLLKNMDPEAVDFATALKLLSLPREVGVLKKEGEPDEPILAHNGRYGPFIKCGDDTRSLPTEISPLDVTEQQALELLAQPKQRGRRSGTPKKPLKTFDESPVTGEQVKLLDGRYGPYVTDGEVNASLPKDASPDEFTFEQALDLLAERAAKAPAKRKKTKKKAAKKKTAKKKTKKKAKKKTKKKSS